MNDFSNIIQNVIDLRNVSRHGAYIINYDYDLINYCAYTLAYNIKSLYSLASTSIIFEVLDRLEDKRRNNPEDESMVHHVTYIIH